MKNQTILGAEGGILNSPILLVLIVVLAVAVVIGIIILIAKRQKINDAIHNKIQKKAEEKQKLKDQKAKGVAFDSNVFAQRNGKEQKAPDSSKGVIDIVQHNETKTIEKVKQEKKKEDAHAKATADDVVSIMQGGVSTAKAYKTADAFEEKKAAEQKVVDDKKSEAKVDDVVSIMHGNSNKSVAGKPSTSKKK